MKRLTLVLMVLTLSSFAKSAFSDVPVFSANGFLCGREGMTVTCKGPIPNGGQDTITGTGHNLVYLTVNTKQEGVPVRYTYFSDTGCLIGYTFNAAGQPVAAVASHRKGAKQTFNFSNKQDYEKIVDFCVKDQPTSTASANSASAPAKLQPSKQAKVGK